MKSAYIILDPVGFQKELTESFFEILYTSDDMNLKKEFELLRYFSNGRYKEVFYGLVDILTLFVLENKGTIDKKKVKEIYMFFLNILKEKDLKSRPSLSETDAKLVFTLAQLLIYLNTKTYPFDSNELDDAKNHFLELNTFFKASDQYEDLPIKNFTPKTWGEILLAL